MIRVLDSAGSTLVEWGRQQQHYDYDDGDNDEGDNVDDDCDDEKYDDVDDDDDYDGDDDDDDEGDNVDDGDDDDDDYDDFQIGAGLYAVGRPVQQKRTAKSAPITPCPSREGPYSTVFFGKPAHGPTHVAGGPSGPIGDVETNPGPSTQTWTCDMCSTEHSINNNKTQQQINSKKTITIIQININGLTTKIHELKNLTDNTKIDIITI